MSPKLIFSTPFCLTQHAPAESKSPWADDVVIIKSLQCVQEKWKFRYMDRTLTSSAKNWKIKYSICFCCSVAKSCLTLCNPMDCSTPGFPVLHYLLEFAQTHVHWLSDAIQPYHTLCLQSYLLPSIFPSITVFSSEPALSIRWPKVWSFNLSISPCNACSVLISLRINWLDLPAVQGTLKSLPQHHSSKAYQFLGTQPSLWCNSHIRTWLLENHSFDCIVQAIVPF